VRLGAVGAHSERPAQGPRRGPVPSDQVAQLLLGGLEVAAEHFGALPAQVHVRERGLEAVDAGGKGGDLAVGAARRVHA
jgi:hypothetical protein